MRQINRVLIPAIFLLLLLWLIIGNTQLVDIKRQLNRIEANQIEIIENQAAINQDSFHSNE
jgi:hypothetical protein